MLRLSVVIPVLDEVERLDAILGRLKDEIVHETIVAAPPGARDVRAMARRHGIESTVCGPGRGAQLNAGAARATGDALLFLHVDTRPPRGFPAMVEEGFLRRGRVWGAFSLRLDRDGAGWRLIDWCARVRSNWRGEPWGDQAIFVRRDAFEKVGGFPDWPLFEDVELAKRLRAIGPPEVLKERVVTSARKFERDGRMRRLLLNQWLLIQYALGVSPEKLARKYYPTPDGD